MFYIISRVRVFSRARAFLLLLYYFTLSFRFCETDTSCPCFTDYLHPQIMSLCDRFKSLDFYAPTNLFSKSLLISSLMSYQMLKFTSIIWFFS